MDAARHLSVYWDLLRLGADMYDKTVKVGTYVSASKEKIIAIIKLLEESEVISQIISKCEEYRG